jgi:DNA primase
LFSDELSRRAFLALADAHGVLDAALELADPDARELLERAAVADLDADPTVEARSLLSAAVRRELAHHVRMTDGAENPEDAEARRRLHQLDDPIAGGDAAEALLGWLQRRYEERE